MAAVEGTSGERVKEVQRQPGASRQALQLGARPPLCTRMLLKGFEQRGDMVRPYSRDVGGLSHNIPAVPGPRRLPLPQREGQACQFSAPVAAFTVAPPPDPQGFWTRMGGDNTGGRELDPCSSLRLGARSQQQLLGRSHSGLQMPCRTK